MSPYSFSHYYVGLSHSLRAYCSHAHSNGHKTKFNHHISYITLSHSPECLLFFSYSFSFTSSKIHSWWCTVQWVLTNTFESVSTTTFKTQKVPSPPKLPCPGPWQTTPPSHSTCLATISLKTYLYNLHLNVTKTIKRVNDHFHQMLMDLEEYHNLANLWGNPLNTRDILAFLQGWGSALFLAAGLRAPGWRPYRITPALLGRVFEVQIAYWRIMICLPTFNLHIH